MAYVVAKSSRRFEIRESVQTRAGPRSITLTTFSVLDEEVIRRAQSRSNNPIDTRALYRSGRRAGAPVADSVANDSARTLLRELAGGRAPSPGLLSLLQTELAKTPAPPDLAPGDLVLWMATTDEQRAEALVDLLRLADALPVRRSGPLRAPRLVGHVDRSR